MLIMTIEVITLILITILALTFLYFGISYYLWLAKRRRRNLEHKRERTEELINAVAEIFAEFSYLPGVREERCYGIPSFLLIFHDKEEMNDAISRGLIAEFTAFIQKKHDHLTPRGQPFDAELAVGVRTLKDIEMLQGR